MVTKDKIKSLVKEYTEQEDMRPINEIGDGAGNAVRRELQARMEKDEDPEVINVSTDDDDDTITTDPIKGIVSPSKKVVSNVCRREMICNEQGKITFGQLEKLIKASQRKKMGLNIGEGVYKSFIRLLPWFIPQIAIGAFVGSGMRGLNKVIKPSLEGTKGYKTWWGKMVLGVMNIAEGDLPVGDPFSKIFFISDGLLEMLGEKYKFKFARYISEIASNKPETEEVPEYFVENELRNYLNQKFLLDPKLPLKEGVTINEGFKEVVLTLGLLLGGHMALSQTQADTLINNPTQDTKERVTTILQNKPLLNDYMGDVKKYGIVDTPRLDLADEWIHINDVDFKIQPGIINRGKTMVSIKFPLNLK